MNLKDKVKERMGCLGLRRWTSERGDAEWDDETTCSRTFRSDNEDIYRAHEDEDDDDWPEFVGEAMLQKAVEEHFRDLPVKVFICDNEKGWFTVAVELKDEKATAPAVVPAPVPAPVLTPVQVPAAVVPAPAPKVLAPKAVPAPKVPARRRIVSRKPRSRRGTTAVGLKQRTLAAIQRARDEKHMTWEAIEERFNLRQANGMTAYRAYHARVTPVKRLKAAR